MIPRIQAALITPRPCFSSNRPIKQFQRTKVDFILTDKEAERYKAIIASQKPKPTIKLCAFETPRGTWITFKKGAEWIYPWRPNDKIILCNIKTFLANAPSGTPGLQILRQATQDTLDKETRTPFPSHNSRIYP